jgi:hypothetical protein
MCLKMNDGDLPNPGKLRFSVGQKGGFSGTVAGALQGKVKNVENPGVKSTPWAPEPQGRRR